MDEKGKALKAWLANSFPDCVIDYEFPLTILKFRINTEKTTYWLYIAREFVDDNRVEDVISAGERAGVIKALQSSSKARWIFLGSAGAKEVDEDFGKNA